MNFRSFTYDTRARIAPALVVALPALLYGLFLVPVFSSWGRLWPLISFGLATWVALTARRKGNDVQSELWISWGGAPTVRRLRFRDNDSSEAEVERRHKDYQTALLMDSPLPSREDEEKAPQLADKEYESVSRRLINRCHEEGSFRLLDRENRNYGYSRNLYGLRKWGLTVTWLAFFFDLGTAVAVYLYLSDRQTSATLLAAGVASLLYLLVWRNITPSWVRPSAEAYADRLVGAAATLARNQFDQ